MEKRKRPMETKISHCMKTYILAEMASSHEGDAKTAEFIIESASNAKANGILFQLIDLDSYIIPSDEDWADAQSFKMAFKDWDFLFEKAERSGLDIWANVYDLKSFEYSSSKNIRGFKLHSSNLENKELLGRIAKTGKDILLSIGGLDDGEIESQINFIKSANPDSKIYLMYGLQNFPTNPEGVNLNFIKSLAGKHSLDWGYQDHSDPETAASSWLPVLAVFQGAAMIEKHLTHDRSKKGQDYEAALNPDEFLKFCEDIRSAEKIICKDINEISPDERKYKEYKTLMKAVAVENIKKGEKFSPENLAVMRSKKGQVAGRYAGRLWGRKAENSYKKFEPVKTGELLKAGIFITCRLKSSRLPMKAIKPILGKPMIGWMIERLKKSGLEQIVLMTSTNPQDDPLVQIAKENKIEIFRGSEDDVLERIRDCAGKFATDLIISVTADDPLKEPIFIRKLIDKYLESRFDFCEIKGLPDGCEMYALDRSAVEKVCEIKKDSDTEIWGPYFRQAGIFKCELLEVKDPSIYRPDYRVTVDTPEDFELVSRIFEELLKEKEYFNVYDICKFLDDNPDLVKINSKITPTAPPVPNFKKKNPASS